MAGMHDGRVRLFDPSTGERRLDVAAHDGAVTSVCISKDGSKLASGSANGSWKLWGRSAAMRLINTASMAQLTAGAVTDMRFHPVGAFPVSYVLQVCPANVNRHNSFVAAFATLEATQGQMDGFFSQLPYKCYLEEVASVGD